MKTITIRDIVTKNREAIQNGTLQATHSNVQPGCTYYDARSDTSCAIGVCLPKETLAQLATNEDLGRPMRVLLEYDIRFENEHLALLTQSLHDKLLTGSSVHEGMYLDPRKPGWARAFLSDHEGSVPTLAMFQEWLDLLESEIS